LPELPLTVQSVSVAVPPMLSKPPPPKSQVLPLKVTLVNVAVALFHRPPPPSVAELLEKVQLVSVTVPSLSSPPPSLPPVGLPWVIVSPDMDAVTLASTWNTRLVPPPLIVTPPAGPVIV
jgi:hypothetical protein